METEPFAEVAEVVTSIRDYAEQEHVTERSVQKWAAAGQIRIVELDGKRYVNAAEPRQASGTYDNAFGNVATSPKPLAKSPDILFEALLSQQANVTEVWKVANENTERARSRWLLAFFSVLVLLIIALVVIAGGGAYAFQHIQNQEARISSANIDTASMVLSLDLAQQTAGESTITTSAAILELTKTVGRLTGENSQLQSENARLITVNAGLAVQLAAQHARIGATGGPVDDLPVSDPNSQ